MPRSIIEIKKDRDGFVGVLIERGEVVVTTLHAATEEIAERAIREYLAGRAAYRRRRKSR